MNVPYVFMYFLGIYPYDCDCSLPKTVALVTMILGHPGFAATDDELHVAVACCWLCNNHAIGS